MYLVVFDRHFCANGINDAMYQSVAANCMMIIKMEIIVTFN